ncbi:hypothetical protein ACGFIU_11785 [Rhodococcus oryzae]|uniref:hypothetical protein n=1 Tax=Rhodococcus oryzae TaxID=2571143 RepID=UPI00371A2AAD
MSGPSERPVAGIRFGETMTGQITLGETDPRSGYRNPGAFGVVVRGTIHIEDLGAFLDDPRHEARLAGEVDIPSLGGRFESDSGRFGLFTPTEQARMTHMVYELGVDIGGVGHWFRGHKEIRVAGPWRLWPATTTLLVTLHEGDREGPVVAAGMLRLRLTAFTALLGSLTVTGGVSMWRRWATSGRFTAFFAGGLISTYLLRRRA